MSRLSIIWGANAVLFGALAVHPAASTAVTVLCGVVGAGCWLRGLQVADRG